MTSFYVHLSWFCILLFLTLSSFLLSLFLTVSSSSLFLSIPLFSSFTFPLTVSFYFDIYASWFFSAIVLISTIIILYSYNYIAPYSNPHYFLWLTILFVVSILLVVSISNIFFLILGWDGLGLISFLLILYYQNQSSQTSGVFTVLINRLGDSFYLLALALLILFYSDLFSFSSNLLSFFVLIIMLLTFITNSAIYPFSPWLPIAIAAPTPISALVHSSTLVTAGLYLLIRFSYLFYSSILIINLILFLSLFTSFYAGINTIFETDLKNLIALSTLSHLGFILLAYSTGQLNLSFFHLLSHALFNSLLFMTIGDIMTNLYHSQDTRYLSSGFNLTPFSSFIILVPIFNLLGLPSMSGYFSNDLVLEIISYSFISIPCLLIVYCNVIFTYYYSYNLVSFSFVSNILPTYILSHSPLFAHSLLLSISAFFSIFFGYFFLSLICSKTLFVCVPFTLNVLPVILNTLFLTILIIFLNLFSSSSVFLNTYLSSMIYLTTIILNFSSISFTRISSYSFLSSESGLFYQFIVLLPFSITNRVSQSTLTLSSVNQLLLLISFLFLFILLI